MSLSHTAGNYRCVYQKLSIFIKYHSLVGQVNFYIGISNIIGISAKATVSISRLSYFCSSRKDCIIKPFRLCCLVDSPTIITALDGLLTAIVSSKCPGASKRIIFITQAVYICRNLIFIYRIISVCVFNKPVLNSIPVKLLGTV